MVALVESPEYPICLQYEWCAIDAVGHVGVFNTFGSGPVPLEVLRPPGADALLDALRALVPSGSATTPASVGHDAEFHDYARRGLFPFDWSGDGNPYTDLSRRYELQAVPDQPTRLDQLGLTPEQMRLLESVRLGLDFRTASSISPQKLAATARGLAGFAPPT